MKKALIAAALASAAPLAAADAVLDWNARADALVVEAKLGTPPAIRAMALVHAAIDEAVHRADARGASVDAAAAAASRNVLSKVVPAVLASIDQAYAAALAPIADGTARSAGIADGEAAAAAVLAHRAGDRPAAPDTYRPHTTPGAYVPTATPAALPWAQRKPWLLADPAQVRPGPPPALASAAWAQAYNEVKALGAKGAARSPEQVEVARFWEYSLPPIYHGVVRSVALQPGRDVKRNARLFAAATQAMDDALIAVFEAKYHYHFWRPTTAIRNGDTDGNDATERDASWTPFSDVPLHPEYPSGHGILAGAVGAVLKAEIGAGRTPELATASPSAKGAVRRWTSVDAFVQEVIDARVIEGVHYRFSMDVAADMGRRIGELAAAKHLRGPRVALLD